MHFSPISNKHYQNNLCLLAGTRTTPRGWSNIDTVDGITSKAQSSDNPETIPQVKPTVNNILPNNEKTQDQPKVKEDILQFDDVLRFPTLNDKIHDESNWHDNITNLSNVQKQCNQSNLPLELDEGISLDVWVQNQVRNQYLIMNDTNFLLNEIRSVGNPKNGRRLRSTHEDIKWARKFQKLQSFQRKHGHCNIPKSDDELGTWVKWQRQMFSNKLIRNSRKALLDSIGFDWRPNSSDTKWYRQYENLKSFQKIHGHCNVPTRSGSLGKWVSNQRLNRTHDWLREDRIRLLDEIGFVWRVRSCGGSKHFDDDDSTMETVDTSLLEFQNMDFYCW